MNIHKLRIALLIPCYNEQTTIARVIKSFKHQLPKLDVYVFDNNSTDNTASEARLAGAKVFGVKEKGKGNVVRRMFADVEADIFIMVDGDDTYEAESIHEMIKDLITNRLDMVVGCRVVDGNDAKKAYRFAHQTGNRFLTSTVGLIFGVGFKDMLSGYRVFSRRYTKSFPALSQGFEIETELTIHALELRMPYSEVNTRYRSRPEDSFSKLSTYKDGLRIFKTISRLILLEKPFYSYLSLSIFTAMISVFISLPIFSEYIQTGLVPRLPTTILSASMMICALLLLTCGIILDSVTRSRQELKRLSYLSISALEINDVT